MPLARIVTLHPDETGSLSQQLKSQGYAVEVVSPEDIVVRPADLEIEFDVCPAARALDRAADVAQHLNADVAVGPGVPETVLRQIADPPAARAVEPVPEEPQPFQYPYPQHEEAPGTMSVPVESGFAALTAQQEIAAPIEEQAVAPEANQQSQAWERPDSALWQNFVDEALESSPAPSQPEAPHTEYDSAALESGLQEEHSEAKPASERVAELIAPAVEKASRAMVAGKALASEAWFAARQTSRELKERLEIRRAEARAAREQRLLDLAKRKALAEERAAELEAARQAASERLRQLLHERGEAAAAQQTPARTQEAAPALPVPASPNGRLATVKTSIIRTYFMNWMSRRYTPQLEAVLTGVAAVTALFAIGLAVAQFQPRPALSSKIDQPYQGVTVKTGGATLAPTPVSVTQPISRPGPVTEQPRSGKQSPAHRTGTASDVTVRHLGTPASRRLSRTEGEIADDVTVRHFGPQRKAPAIKPTPQAGLKHISDM